MGMFWRARSWSIPSAISEQAEMSQRWLHLIDYVCNTTDASEEALNLGWFVDNLCSWMSVFCSKQLTVSVLKFIMNWNHLRRGVDSWHCWVHPPAHTRTHAHTQSWPAEPVYWASSGVCVGCTTTKIFTGVSGLSCSSWSEGPVWLRVAVLTVLISCHNCCSI